ncbi:MAG: hypothetical protein KAJ19_14650 [Gammaproteobacteria bacterium]|nr:hypothetical protein [Gammaproteobacteria bacterium]
MLENKEVRFEKDKIIAIRISTGDEIIGQIKDFDSSSVTLHMPCSLAMQEGGIGLVPATMMGDPGEPVTYERSAIIATMRPNKQFLTVYENHISPVLVPKEKTLIVPK